jgi:hypothetical protein
MLAIAAAPRGPPDFQATCLYATAVAAELAASALVVNPQFDLIAVRCSGREGWIRRQRHVTEGSYSRVSDEAHGPAD